jgi:type IV secretory pathway protease TraF
MKRVRNIHQKHIHLILRIQVAVQIKNKISIYNVKTLRDSMDNWQHCKSISKMEILLLNNVKNRNF